MSQQPTSEPPAGNPQPPRVVRHWPGGDVVSQETEDALDRIVATIKRVQARQEAP